MTTALALQTTQGLHELARAYWSAKGVPPISPAEYEISTWQFAVSSIVVFVVGVPLTVVSIGALWNLVDIVANPDASPGWLAVFVPLAVGLGIASGWVGAVISDYVAGIPREVADAD